jgi:L-asparagine transporter-like permease
VVLSYLFAGVVVFAVIKILARMALDQPGLGAFTEYVRVASGRLPASSVAGCTGTSG